VSAVVFLGGGRITNALIAGLRLSGFRGKLVVHDRHSEKLQRLRRLYNVTPEPSLRRAVAAAHLLVVAVRPQAVGDLLARIASDRNLRRPTVAISLVAGVSLARLRAGIGPPVRWVRAMPSPVCRARRGLTALAVSRSVPGRPRREIHALFARVGAVIEIPEKQFDAFTVTYSSSHGYHALATIARAAEKVGLARHAARVAAAHALADGILAWRENPEPLRGLLAEAATPGGTAAAVMAAMDTGGYPRIVERALRAGIAVARSHTGE
jgi:pyrroline-5-carboxylate reductase